MINTYSILVIAILATCQGSIDVDTKNARTPDLNQYTLYRDPNNPIPIGANDDANENINSSLTTVVLVHGYEGPSGSDFSRQIRTVLLGSEDVNVIDVDWSAHTSGSYTGALNAILAVGGQIADFLTIQGILPANLHLVGFNLGAHIVGITGRSISGDVSRITALDPSKYNSLKLSASDATYVEVIHTDAYGLLSDGISEQLGHADFYPNGGSNQPGCYLSPCSHNRAWEFFAASLIRDPEFLANCCTSITQMRLNKCSGITYPMGGNVIDKTRPGCDILRVNTGRRFPF